MIITDASNLPRFMQCNGNVLLQADPALVEIDTTIREEGNAAHWLASVVFNGQITATEMVDRKAQNGVYITAEMAEHVDAYLSSIRAGEMEWSYSLNGQNWQINGRADHVRYEDLTTLYINDFKYGYTIVEPEMNWTLISHAVGFCVTNDVAPARIVFVIHQPRAPHRDGRVRTWSISYQELLELYQRLNQTLSNPSNMTQTGPHCYKCHAFRSCVARQDAELNAIEACHVAYNANIDNFDLSDRLNEIKRAKALLNQSEKAYEELALHRIVKGEIIKDYTVENELTNRTFKDYVTPDMLDALYGNKGICKRQLPTLKDATAAYGEEVVAELTTRYQKGNKLVRIDANKKGKKLFGSK
ncbi:hypothetical protein P106B_52 [Rhizobium phage vB_RglS_P106B]|uniref:Uncharacterized protein n=1 Tax=Rhizobium phage vB_RglS_P106B TaxID=1458697 RepID=W6E8H1_9CAUD|nr:exonuclease [Rhizobium phage vB_RglS_P106B]AHJ10735.1 hypothetical protein P106B_52 [Rhizobium phage vB_RglS_P106B]